MIMLITQYNDTIETCLNGNHKTRGISVLTPNLLKNNRPDIANYTEFKKAKEKPP